MIPVPGGSASAERGVNNCIRISTDQPQGTGRLATTLVRLRAESANY